MKSAIHPTYHSDAVVSCACGKSFTTGSTKKSIFVEVCHQCHPLFTGEERFVDVKGQVEKFKAKMAFAQKYAAKAPHKQREKKQQVATKSLKDLLTAT